MLKLAKNFALSLRRILHFFLPKICTLVSALLNGGEFTLLRCPKRYTLRSSSHSSENSHSLRSFYLCQMAWQEIKEPKQRNRVSAAPSFSSKKWIKLIPKTIENRKKRLCARLRSRDKHLRKSSDRKAQIRKEGVRSAYRTDLCFSIWRFSQVVFIPRAQPHAQSLFSMSNSFGIKGSEERSLLP